MYVTVRCVWNNLYGANLPDYQKINISADIKKVFKLPFCALLGPMSDDAEVLGTKRRVVNFVVLCECLIKFSFSGRIAFIAQARSTATRVTIRYDT